MDEAKMTALAGMVDEVDGNSPEAQAGKAEAQDLAAQQLSEAQAWATIPATVGKLLCMIVPELGPIYSADNCREWGESMVPVAAKHGWGGPGALPELSLLICTAGFAVPSYLMVRAKVAQLKAYAQADKPQAPPAAGIGSDEPPRPPGVEGAAGGG